MVRDLPCQARNMLKLNLLNSSKVRRSYDFPHGFPIFSNLKPHQGSQGSQGCQGSQGLLLCVAVGCGSGLAMVNSSRCGAGDFMWAGSAGGQAMQVMTQGFLGGRLFGINCNFGGGQSEHMAFVMPEAHANWSTLFFDF